VVAGAGTVVVSGKTYQNALNAADITTLTNAMAADTAAQLNVAATLAKLQAWVYGGQ
jgi:acetyl-CoA carboxylase carboxyltransferase component